MKHNASGRISAAILLVVALSFAAVATVSAESSSRITKDVLKHPCENGYLYDILTAPAGSKEPFSIKKSPNPNDPKKEWRGRVTYRKPPTTPGAKATIVTMMCTDRVGAMVELTMGVHNLGSGPKLSYTDFAVNTPLDPRNTDQLTSAFTPPAKDTNTAVVPSGSGDRVPAIAGEVPSDTASLPANRELYDEKNQGSIVPPAQNSTGRTSSECPTCGAGLNNPQGAAAPAGLPTPEYVTGLNNRISSVATAALEKHPDVAAFGGADVVKACVAAQNCDEVVPKTRGIESFFKTENDANGKYSKIVTDATYSAVKSQTGLALVDRPNQDITRVRTDTSVAGGDMWKKGDSTGGWQALTFNNRDPDHPLLMWTNNMLPTDKTASDIVVFKEDGTGVPVRTNGELVNPGGFVSQVEDRFTTPKTYDTLFSAVVGTNKSESDRANFKLTDAASPVGERTVTVINNDHVQLAALPEKAYTALQQWGDKVYENDFQDEIKKASAGKLSFAPSGAFAKDIGFDQKFAPADALTPLTPDRRYEKQEALLAAVQRYTPEYWASLREPAVVAEFGKIPNDARVRAGAYTYLQPGNQIIWVNGNYKTEWLGQSFDHETLHLVEGLKANNLYYPSDREWGVAMFGDQYGKVYSALSGVDSIATGGSDCTEYDRPEGFPSCYAYRGGPMEHKAEMQMVVMGNYNLAQQEAQKNPYFKKGFDLIVQSLYKASNGTMTEEYLAALPPTLQSAQLSRINTSLTARINRILRSLGR